MIDKQILSDKIDNNVIDIIKQVMPVFKNEAPSDNYKIYNIISRTTYNQSYDLQRQWGVDVVNLTTNANTNELITQIFDDYFREIVNNSKISGKVRLKDAVDDAIKQFTDKGIDKSCIRIYANNSYLLSGILDEYTVYNNEEKKVVECKQLGFYDGIPVYTTLKQILNIDITLVVYTVDIMTLKYDDTSYANEINAEDNMPEDYPISISTTILCNIEKNYDDISNYCIYV